MQIPLERIGLLEDGAIARLRVIETEDRTSSAGNAYVNLTCEVLDDMGRLTGNTIWHTLTMTPKARFMVGKFLDAVGAPKEGTLNSRALKGKVFWAKIGRDTYQGKTKNIITTPLTPDEADRDEDTINNIFSTNFADDEPTNGYNENDISSWEEDDDDSLAESLPDEMNEEDVKF